MKGYQASMCLLLGHGGCCGGTMSQPYYGCLHEPLSMFRHGFINVLAHYNALCGSLGRQKFGGHEFMGSWFSILGR